MGKAYVHTVIEDYSRVAYAEIHDDETAVTATAVLIRAVEWFNVRGVTVERVLTDGWAYARCYTSEAERRGELDGWLHYYNQHCPHTACGNQTPFSRLINVPGQYT